MQDQGLVGTIEADIQLCTTSAPSAALLQWITSKPLLSLIEGGDDEPAASQGEAQARPFWLEGAEQSANFVQSFCRVTWTWQSTIIATPSMSLTNLSLANFHVLTVFVI